MVLNLDKDYLENRDIEVLMDVSKSMCTCDCPGKISRFDFAKGWVETLVQEVEPFDDDGPTIGFFNHELRVYENTTYNKVAGVFARAKPNGGTDTANAISARLNDYLDQRLGAPRRTMFGRTKPGVANPNVKKRTLLYITDGMPEVMNESRQQSEQRVQQVIIDATKRMSAGGLTPDDLVISIIQVGNDPNAKAFLERLNNGLEKLGATMDIVGCITCELAKGLSTQRLLELALAAD